jgi:photosystem II stability/assembly factor-like uncharacterized protein
MKKQLLTIFSALMVGSAIAQVPSPSLTNQDATFPNATSITFPGIKFLDAVDANVVWAIGYDAQAPNRNYNWWSKTTNGGTSFTNGNVFPDTSTYQIANMEGIDANTAWVSSFMKSSQSKGAIHRTTNGGANWVNMTAPGMYTNTTAFTNMVSFLTPSIGITQGDPVNGEFEIWRTTDGGNTWTMVPGANIPNPSSSAEYSIVDLYAKFGSSNFWFGTNAGRIYYTTDAGVTWSVTQVGGTGDVVTEIAFSSPLRGLAYVSNGTSIDVYNTIDGGVTWNPIFPSGHGLNDISGVPGTGVFVSVDNPNDLVSSSTDNGLTWTNWGSTGIGYINVDFVNGTTGWVGTYDIPQTFGNLWKYNSSMTGTVDPVASFYLPTYVCLSGNTGTAQTVNNSTGNPAPTFSWSSSPTAVFSNPTATAPSITFPGSGTYTITLVSTNSIGTNTSSQVVTVATCVAPVASFTMPTTGCTSYSFGATNGSTGSPSPTYSWSILPSGATTINPSSGSTNPDFKVTTPGVYTVNLISSNPAGNSTASQTINVVACPPNANFSIPDTIRFCDTKTFSTTNVTANPPGATGPITYTWSVNPLTGVSIFPNFFQTNLQVTISNINIPQYTVTLRARNASGTSTVTQVIVVDDCSIPTGIAKNSLDNIISVYPNPVRDHMTIHLPTSGESHSLKITNILGSVLYSETTTKENVNINMANQPKGVYFLTVESKEEKVTKKIIVE